jgi:hypothetical protein
MLTNLQFLGFQPTSKSDDSENKARSVILKDRKMAMENILSTLNISIPSGNSIANTILGFSQISTQCFQDIRQKSLKGTALQATCF